MSAPESSPQWQTDYFRDAPAGGHAALGRGLVGHVPIVAWLLIVQGLLELVLGLFCLLVIGVVVFIPDEAFDATDKLVIGGIYAVVAVPSLVCAGLRLVAGVFNLRYRRRGLGMVALAVGLLTVLTGVCALTAIGIGIYGLIVYVNDSVVAAFRMGDAGRTKAEINAAFPPQ
jgi:hypothetical protein